MLHQEEFFAATPSEHDNTSPVLRLSADIADIAFDNNVMTSVKGSEITCTFQYITFGRSVKDNFINTLLTKLEKIRITMFLLSLEKYLIFIKRLVNSLFLIRRRRNLLKVLNSV